MKVTIFGSGYVGLVTGACIAESGSHVLCVDIDAPKIRMLQAGEVPIYEPGLTEMIAHNTDANRLAFTTDTAAAVDHGEFQMIAVGTPPGEDGSADLQHVLAVAKSIGEHMSDHKIIINKSTVPVGTADRVRDRVYETLAERGAEVEFDVVSNPEFLKEGAAIDDFMKPDRIIVGCDNKAAAKRMHALYEPFNRNHDRMLFMDLRSAELTKYAANAMLATKISFMNEVSNLAARVGADIEKVRIGIGSDPRIGYNFIYPGCGFGGSCFPKDVRALAQTAKQHGVVPELLDAVQNVNDRQKSVLPDKLKRYFGEGLGGRTIAIWGLAFKPNTDDMREASSVVLIDALLEAGAKLRVYDPEAGAVAAGLYRNQDALQVSDSALAAADGADALVIVTEWLEFRSPDFNELKRKLAAPVIFDGRNLYDPEQVGKSGFEYYAIGRGKRLTQGE